MGLPFRTRAPLGINPHHLTSGRRELTRDGPIEEVTEPGRDRTPIPVIGLADRRRGRTAFERAAARKRLLQARYHGRAGNSAYAPNMIADAGERVAHASLRQAAAEAGGYLLARRKGDKYGKLLGTQVPGGPLGDAAYLATLDRDNRPVAITAHYAAASSVGAFDCTPRTPPRHSLNHRAKRRVDPLPVAPRDRSR